MHSVCKYWCHGSTIPWNTCSRFAPLVKHFFPIPSLRVMITFVRWFYAELGENTQFTTSTSQMILKGEAEKGISFLPCSEGDCCPRSIRCRADMCWLYLTCLLHADCFVLDCLRMCMTDPFLFWGFSLSLIVSWPLRVMMAFVRWLHAMLGATTQIAGSLNVILKGEAEKGKPPALGLLWWHGIGFVCRNPFKIILTRTEHGYI